MSSGLAVDLETKTLVGEQRRELVELRPLHGLFGIDPVDLDRTDEGGELLLAASRANRTGHGVALADPRLADHIRRHVGVHVAGEVAG